MKVQVTIDADSEHGRYLMACARIRDVSITVLMNRIADAVARDQLVAGVLDDDAKRTRRKGEHGYEGPRL